MLYGDIQRRFTEIDNFDFELDPAWSGTTSDYTITTTNAYNGHAVRTSVEFSPLTSQPGDGLPNYFSKGEKMECYVRSPQTIGGSDAMDTKFRFGHQDGSNTYQFQIEWFNGDQIYLASFVSGSVNESNISNRGTNYASTTWYRLEFTWDDGTLGGTEDDITVGVYDTSGTLLDDILLNNSDHANKSGLGFLCRSNGEDLYWDEWGRGN